MVWEILWTGVEKACQGEVIAGFTQHSAQGRSSFRDMLTPCQHGFSLNGWTQVVFCRAGLFGGNWFLPPLSRNSPIQEDSDRAGSA